jgi:hypothetical protein
MEGERRKMYERSVRVRKHEHFFQTNKKIKNEDKKSNQNKSLQN